MAGTATVTAARERAQMDAALLAARIVLGVIFLAHGSQKVFGAFGGPGLAGTVQFMGPIGYLVALGEFGGGLGLLVGLLSRFSAASLVVIMVGAIVKVHGQNGFFLGAKPGYEYNLALIGLASTVLIAGPGRWAVSRLWQSSAARQTAATVPALQ